MKKNFISAVIFVATNVFAAQAAATATIDLQDFNGTLIDNKWQQFDFVGPDPFQTSTPYSTATDDRAGSITLSPIIDFNDNSHIHVSGGDGNPATPTIPFIHGDVGGFFLDGEGSHNLFSLHSMDVLIAALQSDNVVHDNASITVRGYRGGVNGMIEGIVQLDGITMQYSGGALVAETTIDNGFVGVVDFLAADVGFGAVDHVEFFFTDFYRVKPSSFGDTALTFEFDNIQVAAVPVPAAVWLFGTGLVGLVTFGKRKRENMAV